ncbi:hypothetical protein [Ornithinimicrobium kibberense]|uniref:hypothetical protein n=1 Tax=Ornithinimicrobium kibberense TaxID=282060 RepID=UPI00361D9234
MLQDRQPRRVRQAVEQRSRHGEPCIALRTFMADRDLRCHRHRAMLAHCRVPCVTGGQVDWRTAAGRDRPAPCGCTLTCCARAIGHAGAAVGGRDSPPCSGVLWLAREVGVRVVPGRRLLRRGQDVADVLVCTVAGV